MKAKEAKIIKDERTINIKEEAVEFRVEQIQEYTKEAAKNVYVQLIEQKEQKEAAIVDFSKQENDIKEKIKIDVEKIAAELQGSSDDITNEQMDIWKKVQQRANFGMVKKNVDRIKDEIKNLDDALKYWDVCKDLPETAYEKAMKDFKNKQNA